MREAGLFYEQTISTEPKAYWQNAYFLKDQTDYDVKLTAVIPILVQLWVLDLDQKKLAIVKHVAFSIWWITF